MLIVALLLVGFEGEVPDFNRDVWPLLSDRCFACHVPDDGMSIFRHQGRDFRLTDVHARVVHDLIA